MPSKLTHEKRARRYLQASMESGYTGLPAEHRAAKDALMRSHERAYPGVREHALAGTSTDFDKPLTAGEREHQQELRDRDGLQHSDVLRIRNGLRGTGGGRRRAQQRPSNPRTAGPRAAAAGAAAAGGAIDQVVGGGGNSLMYFIGVMLLLSLVYLLVAGKGAGVITGLVNTVVAGVRVFVAPVDPIAAAEKALGATPTGITGTIASGATGHAPVGSSSVRLTPSGQLHGGGGTGAAPSSGGFVPAGQPFTLRRKDQGRDILTTPGAGLQSTGAGEVERIASDPSGFGPDYPVVKFTSGPDAGREVYFGHTDAALPAHAKFSLGAILARTSKTGHNAPPGWAEIGYAHGGVPGPFGQPSPF